ncbi:cytochrome c [Halobacteriovorax sp. HFRX-2_2]|uniref:c-type cytochrome n=1 Tax=unclassified Halobacteriovorax TaxID=2639665 RepID=UPI003710AA2E
MRNLVLLFTLFLAYSSCSSVNTESRQHFENKSMRHGVVPVAESEDKTPVTRIYSAESVLRGRRIYMNKCSQCHGENGRGVDKVDLQELSKEIPNFNFYLLVSSYKQKMPGWKNVLTENEIKDLENYIYSLAKK